MISGLYLVWVTPHERVTISVEQDKVESVTPYIQHLV
jgi:hypothetical protein